MKVCTDACLFGAWTVKQILQYKPDVSSILDIGTGTGLLSLMLAQRCRVPIEAVEINAEASLQAAENFSASGWHDLEVHNIAIADFKPGMKFDFIVTNPPFFEGDLLSPDITRNAAMHDRYLTLNDLLASIRSLLHEDGYAAVLLPAARENYFRELLNENQFDIAELMHVRQSVNHSFFRVMFIITLQKGQNLNESEMHIHDASKNYSPEFRELLKDYYLAF